MKKITLFIIVLLSILVFNPTELIADAANIIHAPGGNVKVMNSEFIKMKNEQIYITICEDKCKYRIEYTFVNTGDEQTVLMGFPNSKIGRTYGINDFLAFEGTSKFEVFRKDEEKQSNYEAQKVYECFEVHFNKGETKHITNTYTQGYIASFDDEGEVVSSEAIYILTTGASWKGTIDTISVFITSEIPKNQLIERTGFFYSSYESDVKMKQDTIIENHGGLSISPGNYIIEQGIYKMVFTDIEPDFDIIIGEPHLFVNRLYASSELEDKNGRYSVKNIIDENTSTAWVEGKENSGINEFITIYIPGHPRVSFGLYKIKKIGIINGYAKNNDIFKQNNRVKKLRLEYGDHVRTFALKDTIVMQYLKFNEPVLMKKFKITILDVYKGSKYDDTCISEIKIFPVKE